MKTKKKIIKLLKRQNKKVMSASAKLSSELQELAYIASDATGIQFQADICTGDEIEFRPIAPDGVAIQEPIATRLEDIIYAVNSGDITWIKPNEKFLTYEND